MKQSTTAKTRPWHRRPGTLLSLLLSAALTAGLFYYLSRETSWQDWIDLYRRLDLACFAAFLGLFLASMLLKAMRYQILLGASGSQNPPPLSDLVTLTFVSNLFVDLLPARSGSLAYIVFLNRKLKVELPACFSSFAFSFIFDMIGMLPLFLLAIIIHGISTGRQDYLLWALLGALALISLAALALMEKVLRLMGRILARLAMGRAGRLWDLAERLAGELERIAEDITQVKRRGVYGRLLVLSVVIRLFKYVGLYLLVVGLAQQFGPQVVGKLGFGVVLFALIAAEATASLPVSGIAGFGAYEGVMMATLAAAGLDGKQAALLSFGLHLLTQVIDYSLGSLCLFRLSLINRKRPGRSPSGQK